MPKPATEQTQQLKIFMIQNPARFEMATQSVKKFCRERQLINYFFFPKKNSPSVVHIFAFPVNFLVHSGQSSKTFFLKFLSSKLECLPFWCGETCATGQWKRINHKQSARLQHLSRLKPSDFLFEFFC